MADDPDDVVGARDAVPPTASDPRRPQDQRGSAGSGSTDGADGFAPRAYDVPIGADQPGPVRRTGLTQGFGGPGGGVSGATDQPGPVRQTGVDRTATATAQEFATGLPARQPGPDPYGLAGLWPTPPPAPVVVKRDLLPAVGVFGVIALFGLALGFAWSRLAPSQLVQIVDGGQLVPLRSDSYHRFDDLVLFVLMSLGAGLVTGSAVWAMRERRGPVYLLAATAGAALAAWLASRVGVSWAEAQYPVPAAPALGDVLTLAPRLESAWAFVAWPFGAALAYALAAAWNGMDDLGRRLG